MILIYQGLTCCIIVLNVNRCHTSVAVADMFVTFWTAVNAVLGSAESGSKEEHGYKVLLLFNTVVRVDYYVYGYKMFSTGITDEKRNGIVMVCTVGVVDMKSVGLETLVYLLGQQAATSMTFLDDQKAMWQARKQQLEIYSKKPRDLNQWTEFE